MFYLLLLFKSHHACLYLVLSLRWLHSKGTRATHPYDTISKPPQRSTDGLTFSFNASKGCAESKLMEIDPPAITNNSSSVDRDVALHFKSMAGVDYNNILSIASFTPLRSSSEERALVRNIHFTNLPFLTICY